MINIIELINDFGLELKNVNGANGGEISSSCPACGGVDRFRIWPNRTPEKGGRYWCRQCGKKGDAIQFLIDFKNMRFRAAKEFLGADVTRQVSSCPAKKRIPEKTSSLIDSDKWASNAERLVKFANEALLNSPELLEKLQVERGLTAETVKRASLGWLNKNYFIQREACGLSSQRNDNGNIKTLFIPAGLIIPRFTESGRVTRIRVRKARGDAHGKYHVLQGSNASPLEIGLKTQGKPVVVVESELDAILLAQEIPGVSVIALGSVTIRPGDALAKKLKASPYLLNALDSDPAGTKQSLGWWKKNFKNSTRTLIPRKYGKDPTEAFLNGLALIEWYKRACMLAEKKQRVRSSCVEPEKNKDTPCKEVTAPRILKPSRSADNNKTAPDNNKTRPGKENNKTMPGKEWVMAHLDELHHAGFTEDDLFSESLPKGIVFAKAFQKKGLDVKIEPGLLTFTWMSPRGDIIRQTGRPEQLRHERTQER